MDDRTFDARGVLLESWFEFHEAIESRPDVRDLLFDPVTGLPTTPLLFPRIRLLLEERGEVSLLCVKVERLSVIEDLYGWQAYDEVMREVGRTLAAFEGAELRDLDLVAEQMVSGNAFVIVLSPPRDSIKIDVAARQQLAQKIQASVREHLAGRLVPPLYAKVACFVGAATVEYDESVRLERLVHRGLDAAMADAGSRETAERARRNERLRSLIEQEDVRTVVRPVMDLNDGHIIGYKAVSFGPDDGEFGRPDRLVRAAYDADLVVRLERLCRRRALEAAATLPEGRLLFLGIEADAVADPQLREIMATSLLSQAEITADRVVLEVGERNAITDFAAFRSTVEYLRALGYLVAIGDAGAGYGSLRCLAEARPAWIKLDAALVAGCDVDPVRCRFVEAIVEFAATIGAAVVAEGIRTPAEVDSLKVAGVRFGQGHGAWQSVPPFPPDDTFLGVFEDV
jgi:EAL domain-containing protein (putative c-di-GMP-specific phosphodiesterase class I)